MTDLRDGLPTTDASTTGRVSISDHPSSAGQHDSRREEEPVGDIEFDLYKDLADQLRINPPPSMGDGIDFLMFTEFAESCRIKQGFAVRWGVDVDGVLLHVRRTVRAFAIDASMTRKELCDS